MPGASPNAIESALSLRIIPWKLIRIVTFYVGLIGIWKLLAVADIWPSYVFPAPDLVWDTLWRNIDSGRIPDALTLSLKRMAIGYSLAMGIGLFLGLMMGAFKWVDECLETLLLGIQSLPNVAWLPLGLIWFGLNDRAILFVVVMGSMSSMAISARGGIRNIPPLQLRAASMFGGHAWQRYRYVILPAMFPSLVQGLRLGWSFAWHALMAGELLFVSQSLGYLLSVGRELNDIRLVMAVMVVIVVVGTTVDRIVFAPLERRVSERWGLVPSSASARIRPAWWWFR